MHTLITVMLICIIAAEVYLIASLTGLLRIKKKKFKGQSSIELYGLWSKMPSCRSRYEIYRELEARGFWDKDKKEDEAKGKQMLEEFLKK